MTSSSTSSPTTTSISTLGSRVTTYSLPRYTAVCPFCRPCPRTSVTVRPEMLSFSSASLTSSTLFGRMMDLTSFTAVLEHSLQPPAEPVQILIRHLGSFLCDVKHVDRSLAFGANEHQVDV